MNKVNMNSKWENENPEFAGINAFGIRPKFYDGESLSSYLHRLADVNFVPFYGLVEELFKDDNFQIDYSGFRLDVKPSIYLNLNKVSILIKKDKSEVLNHSLFNVYKKFDYEKNLTDLYRNMNVANIFNTKKRMFCPLCINKNKGVYKIIWQFSDVNMCDEHRCELVSECLCCNGTQKYVFTGLADGLCSECREPLKGEIKKVNELGKLSDQINKINDCYFLLSPATKLFEKIDGFDLNQSMIIKVFYAIQLKKSECKVIDKLNSSYIFSVVESKSADFLLRTLKGTYYKYFHLSTLSTVLKRIKLSIIDFSKIIVPDKYIQSIKNLKKVIEEPKCNPLLCRNYNKCSRLETLFTKNKVYYTKRKVCRDCCVQYGYNLSNDCWEILNIIGKKSIQVKEFLFEGHSIKYISKKLSIYSNSVGHIIGYLLKQKLLDDASTEKYSKYITSFEEVKFAYKKFQTRRNGYKSEFVNNNVHPINFYFHFYDFEIQKEFFLEQHSDTLPEQEILDKIEKYIKNCGLSGVPVTQKGFRLEFNVTRNEMLKSKVYREMIENAKLKQQTKKRKDSHKIMINRVRHFFEVNPVRLVTTTEVCEYLGYSRGYVHYYLPMVFSEISKAALNRRNDFYKTKAYDLKRKAEEYIFKNISIYNEFPKLIDIKKELGIKLSKARNPEVYAHIIKLRKELT
ncbi:TniQ family protein [Bacillus sp. JRC01]|nr:TniQ family protein [Bacillus sp. JRC01]